MEIINGEMMMVFYDAVKKIDIWDFPYVMIVCLKRFDNFGRKRNDLIDFPVDNLDLKLLYRI